MGGGAFIPRPHFELGQLASKPALYGGGRACKTGEKSELALLQWFVRCLKAIREGSLFQALALTGGMIRRNTGVSGVRGKQSQSFSLSSSFASSPVGPLCRTSICGYT